MSNTLEDTQPKSPFKDHPIESAREILPDEDESPRGPGCGMMGLMGGLVLLIAVLIVALSAAAGWTAGQREANVHATATQNAAVREQLERIPQEIAAGNLVLLNVRINYLATVAPNAPGLADYIQTATMLAVQMEPTATPTPSPTPETTAEPEATVDIVLTPGGDNQQQLASMLQQAQTAVNGAQWSVAAEWLEAINALDPNYEAVLVRQLLTDSMNSYALQLYQSNQPALANTVVGRIQSRGLPLREGLSYERDVAEMFLSAQAAAVLGDPRAVNNLQQIINQGSAGRYYTQARDLLYDYYVRQGDAYANDPNFGYCPAVQQYQNAVNVFSSGTATGKLRTASDMCAQATPTPDPLLGEIPGEPIAPIGEPGQ